MDNVAKLKKDIEALKKGIDNPSTPENFKDKMRSTMAMLQKQVDEASGGSGGSDVVKGIKKAVSSMKTTSRPPKTRRKSRGYGEGYDISEDEMRDYEPEKPKKPRGKGKPNPDFAKVQKIAKELKAKDPSLKHTKAVSMAWEQVRGGGAPKKEAPKKEAPKKEAPKPTPKSRAKDLKERVKKNTKSKDRDGVRYAKPVGKRVSKEGNTYYEYRENRTDSNIGKRSYKKPRLFAKGGNVGEFNVGQSVIIRSDNDNENYDKYRGKELVITHKATSEKEHRGYDSSMEGQGLYDFVVRKTGETVPFSLYDYEIEQYSRGGMMHGGEHYADGGRVSDMADYITKYDIKSIEVEMDGKKVTLEGSQLLDGIYVKKGSFMAGGMTYKRGGNTGNYNYKRSYKLDRARIAMSEPYERYYKRKTK